MNIAHMALILRSTDYVCTWSVGRSIRTKNKKNVKENRNQKQFVEELSLCVYFVFFQLRGHNFRMAQYFVSVINFVCVYVCFLRSFY